MPKRKIKVDSKSNFVMNIRKGGQEYWVHEGGLEYPVPHGVEPQMHSPRTKAAVKEASKRLGLPRKKAAVKKASKRLGLKKKRKK